MPVRKNLIPFAWLPASWGLRGRSRAIAEAEYQYEGIDLDRKLVEIEHANNPQQLTKCLADIDCKHGNISSYERDMIAADVEHAQHPAALAIAKLKIGLQHQKITQYDHDQQLAEIEIADEQQRKLAQLAIDLKHERISEQQYERKVSDIKEEPWVAMPRISWDPVDSSKTFFEIDYNDHFVEHLRANGYQGSETHIIDTWINDVCSSVADEMNHMSTADNFVTTGKRANATDSGFTEHH